MTKETEEKVYTFDDILKMVESFNNDPDIRKLRNYYGSLTWMEILEVTRYEKAHSSFLSWLFDENRNCGLGTMPLKLLLELLYKEDNTPFTKYGIDGVSVLTRSIDIEKIDFQTEFHIKELSKDKDIKGWIDIYGSFLIDGKQYALIIENKVKSRENTKKTGEDAIWQTNKYFDFFDSKSKNQGEKIKYFYVFLSPMSKNAKAQNEHFINISYEMLAEGVIQPLISLYDSKENDRVVSILKEYLKILNKPITDNPNESNIILYTGDCTGLFKKIEDKYKGLFDLYDKANGCSSKYDENVVNLIQGFWETNDDILVSVCPSKSSNRIKFADLDIEPGTKLYLAQRAKSTNRATRSDNSFVEVRTIDYNTKVKFVSPDDGSCSTVKLSRAAKELAPKYTNTHNSTFWGLQWFILEDESGQLINLATMSKK